MAANLLIGNRTLSADQIEKVTMSCEGCHGGIPRYNAAIKVHDKHASLNCSHCHSDINGLETLDSVHSGLEWLGIGVITLVFIGIVVNSFVINRKGQVN